MCICCVSQRAGFWVDTAGVAKRVGNLISHDVTMLANQGPIDVRGSQSNVIVLISTVNESASLQ